MADDWKSNAFRQRIIAQLEELIRQTPAGNQKSAHDLEHQVKDMIHTFVDSS